MPKVVGIEVNMQLRLSTHLDKAEEMLTIKRVGDERQELHSHNCSTTQQVAPLCSFRSFHVIQLANLGRFR